MRSWATMLLLVWAAGQPFLLAQERSVVAITIKTNWYGHLVSQESRLRYTQKDGHLTLNGQWVDQRKVEALKAALEIEPVRKDDAFVARIPQMWLDRYAGHEARRTAWWRDDSNATLFEARFRYRAYMSWLFLDLSRGVTLDDDPRVEVTIGFTEGVEWTVRSDSNHLFMLPWHVNQGDGEIETFDINIARAIGMLMPRKTTNRWRLGDAVVAEELGWQVRNRIENGRDDAAYQQLQRNSAAEQQPD